MLFLCYQWNTQCAAAASLSSRTIVYKGMFLVHDLRRFYDLAMEGIAMQSGDLVSLGSFSARQACGLHEAGQLRVRHVAGEFSAEESGGPRQGVTFEEERVVERRQIRDPR